MAGETSGRILSGGCAAPRAATPTGPRPASATPAGPGSRLRSRSPSPSPSRPTPRRVDAPETIAGRYRVEGFLGRGGRKRVYRARDAEGGGREVAVAVFDTEDVAETVLARARREARAMGKLGDHPHIVTRPRHRARSGGVPVHRQRVHGRRRRRRGCSTTAPGAGSTSSGRSRSPSTSAAALEHAHARGIIHRDLKPANVWLGDDGAARLGDFGLATPIGSSRVSGRGDAGRHRRLHAARAGARAQLRRRARDLYSLGAMLYELVTGRPPFPGDDAVAIIGQHLQRRRRWRRRGTARRCPPALDRWSSICSRSARRPPGRAPPRRGERSSAAAAASGRPPRPASRVRRTRSRRWPAASSSAASRSSSELRGVLEDALAGRGRLLLLVGEPGIGKTRTAEELATYARVRGARVLWGRCYEGEGAARLLALGEALRGYVRDADPVGLRWQLGSRRRRHRPDRPRAAPSGSATSASRPRIETEQARFRLFDSVTALPRRAPRATAPLVLVLDDLHWADEPSLLLLAFVARELADSGLLLVGTYRDVELGRHHPLAETLGDLARLEGTRRVALRRPRRRRGSPTTSSSPPASTARRRTSPRRSTTRPGQPVLRRRGRAPAGRRGPARTRPAAGARSRSPRACARSSAAGSTGSPTPPTRCCGSPRVCGREFRLDVLDRVCDRPPTEIEAALAGGGRRPARRRAAGRRGRFSFSHALVRETLQAEVPAARARAPAPPDRRGARGGLRRRRSTPTSASSPTTSSRRRRWASVDRAVDYATRAARAARERLAYEDAALLYEQGARRARAARPSPTGRAGSSCCSSSARRRPAAAAAWRRARDARAGGRARARARADRRTWPGRRSGSACSRSPGSSTSR